MVAKLLLVRVLLLQAPATDTSFFRERDGRVALGVVAATAVVAIFDERIARWARQPSVQGDSSRRELVGALTVVNETPLTLAAIATFGVGRLAKWPTVADVGLHVAESLIATIAAAEVVRVASGRKRPRVSPDDAFALEPGKGLTHFENRAFPSLHASVAFATASSLAEELRLRKPAVARSVAPILYVVALVPGLTRIYLDQHWASDVLAGTALGAFLGSRVVRYAHGRRTNLDRVLLGMHFAVRGQKISAVWSLDY